MTWSLGENLLALILAACFVAVGICLTSRAPRSLREVNECFLAGLSALALVLFPLTYLSPHHAVFTCTAIAATALIVCLRAAWKRSRMVPGPGVPGSVSVLQLFRRRFSRIEYVAGAVIIGATLQFFIHNLRLSYLWDGYQIWATKALLLFHKGGLSRDWFMPGEYERVLEYPPLLPLWESMIAFVRGEFEWNSLKPIFPFFFISTLISVYYLVSAVIRRELALFTAAIVAIIPCFGTRFSIGGYADMPQACLLVGAISVTHYAPEGGPLFRRAAPWIVAGVCMVKVEGGLLLGILMIMLALLSGFRWATVRRYLDVVAVVVVAFASRFLYSAWLGQVDRTYGPIDREHLIKASNLGLQVLIVCSKYLFDREEWGLLWPMFLLSAIVLVAIGPRVLRALALGSLSALAAYTLIFYFTNWEFKLHIDQAYNRLLVQITPIAVVVCVGAQWEIYCRLRCFGVNGRKEISTVLDEVPSTQHAKTCIPGFKI